MSNTVHRHRLVLVSAVLVVLLVPTTGFGQTSINTGAIQGTITDGTGGALPGVTVTVTSPRLQGERTAVSDMRGEYVVPLLPPGTYRAEYVLSGMKPQVRDKIVVNAGQKTHADVTITLEMSETVTVTADQVVVDTTQTQQQTTMKETVLKYTSIGSGNRSYQQAMQFVPEAVGTGNSYVAGANQNSNTFMIDGINALTDPVTHTFASNMVFDAIQEISVQTFGKDAEYRSSGGTINIITKSGGNDFSGSVDYRYFDPDFFTQTNETYPAAPLVYGGAPNGQPTLRFNKDTITDKSKQGQATFGGPLMLDRLWFFTSGHRPETSRIAPNVFGFQPGSRDFTGWNTLGKLTFTPFANHTLAARFSDSHARITNISYSSYVPEVADGFQAQYNKNLSLSYDGVMSSRWLVNAQIGRTPGALSVGPMNGDESIVGYSDLDSGISYASYTNAQSRESYRNELLISSTYYLERWGTHAFKAGVYFDHNGFESSNYRTGDLENLPGLPSDACTVSARGATGLICGVSYSIRAGVPVTATVSVRNPALGADAKGRSFYVQDQWSPITPLTIRAGIRYDHVAWESSKPVPSFKMLQPRLGIAYDVFNNGGSVLHVYGGRIMDENQVTLPNNLNSRYSGTATWTYSPTAKTFSFTRTTIAAGGYDVDPDLEPTFSNAYSVGWTQRLFGNTSLDVTAERRTSHDMFNLYFGTTTALLPTGIFTNCPADQCDALRSEFNAIVTKIESRPTRNSDVSFSWVHGRTKGSTAGDNSAGQNLSSNFYYYPVNFTNTFGYTPDHNADRFKLSGLYRLPLDFTVSGSYYWDSGSPWSVTKSNLAGYGTEFIEPRGSRRLPPYHQLDMQVQKDFDIGPVKAGLIASVLNVFNTELPTGINGNAGTRAIAGTDGRLLIDPDQTAGANRLSPTFGRYTSFQRPRRFEAGIRFEF